MNDHHPELPGPVALGALIALLATMAHLLATLFRI
jgi:hypothetical protein